MGKYIGPKSKIARKFGEAIFGADRVLEKRNFPPGQHGLARKRKKVSEYGQQLSEKQKAKATYGLLEKQFSRTYEQAARMGGIRHRLGLPVRGQSTKNNARTRKGKKKTVANKKKATK